MYKPTIGIEVHVELKTKSKMFCGCMNDPHAAKPNVNVCPICMAHPGTLPRVNKEAVKKLVTVGHAVGGEIADFSEFDRKNYFYPDIPKAYQISQYKFPFVKSGEIGGVKLRRIHLEEDTARSQHDHGSGSVVDFNRAGVPLMELVTEPVIHDEKTAVAFGRELQLLLRSLGVSDANMEKGEMRVEANISVSKTDTLGTLAEVKNLNSFKAMEQAILFEIKRQTAVLEKGEELVQETRGWDENRSKTFSQRVKETAEDYRYFPDPDIPKMRVSEIPDFDKSRLTEMLDLSPTNKRLFYAENGISDEMVELIISNVRAERYFNEVASCLQGDEQALKLAANYLTSDLFALAEEDDSFFLEPTSAHLYAKLISMISLGTINSRVAKDLLPEVVTTLSDPEVLVKDRGLAQLSTDDDLLPVVEQVIAEHNAVAEEFKAGKEASLQFLIGQGMKATRGSADPAVLAKLLKSQLSK